MSNFIVDSRFVYPIIDRFSLQLISPVSWEIIPGTRLVRNEDLFPFSVFFCFLFLVFSCIIIDLVKYFQFHMNLISRPQTYCLHLLHDKNFHINIRTDHMVHDWFNGLTSLKKKGKVIQRKIENSWCWKIHFDCT